jgi:hypothetical protein
LEVVQKVSVFKRKIFIIEYSGVRMSQRMSDSGRPSSQEWLFINQLLQNINLSCLLWKVTNY